MSRIGNKSIPIPKGVKVNIADRKVEVQGPLGKLETEFPPSISVSQDGSEIVVKRLREYKRIRAYHGLYRALINNMVIGVTNGYTIHLDIMGLGYRGEPKGKGIMIYIGYGHPIYIEPPEGIKLEIIVPKKGDKEMVFTPGTNFRVSVSGIDKALVGQVAANIRKLRKPNPYKGYGIRYFGEEIKLKPGKAGA